MFDAVRSTIKRANRRVESVRILLAAVADPLHVNRKGETPRSGRNAAARVISSMRSDMRFSILKCSIIEGVSLNRLVSARLTLDGSTRREKE